MSETVPTVSAASDGVDKPTASNGVDKPKASEVTQVTEEDGTVKTTTVTEESRDENFALIVTEEVTVAPNGETTTQVTVTQQPVAAQGMSIEGTQVADNDDSSDTEARKSACVCDLCCCGFTLGNPTSAYLLCFGFSIGRPCGVKCCIPCYC